MHPDTLVQRLAELVVRAGANVQPGRPVHVVADIAHADIARAVADQAYAAGASLVEVDWSDVHVRRSAVAHASLESLTATRAWMLERYAALDAADGSFIVLTGSSDPALMIGLDPARIAAVPAEEEATRRRILLSGRVTWSIVAAPNPGWARQIFGEPDLDRLWQAIAVALRLDEPDPVAAWRERSATLAARAKALDALRLTSVHYVGAGTDLTVGLLPGTRWTGGGLVTEGGVEYLPNIPTEEVFTSPDRRSAEGVIRLTRPLVMRTGGVVDGLQVTFAGGRIVDVVAESGGALVRSQLETDEGARSLGEVSLVDRESRIAQAAWSSTTPSSTRTPPATSPGDRASRSPWKADRR